jgi:hypothetical protein
MAFENRYSALDRALHRVAFLTWPAQIALSSVEDRLFKTRLTGIEVKKPVFITALPRAGTTLLLEMLVALDEFASHCYRDMPFVLIPMLWDRFAASFRQSDVPRERAHGDGMLVNVDSPEAFEEVVWKAFWCEHYKADHIVLWNDEEDLDFSDFLLSHVRKIIALPRNGPATPPPRYVSKNNLNIARLAVVRRRFPDAVIIVPFRHPLQHAASLLRQHCNFLKIHNQDRFACDYMAAIGHYDFGDNLRPVNFDGWLASAQSSDPTTISFWVEYWTAAYEHLLKQQASARVQFLSYEALCEQPAQGLARLADVIEIQERNAFLKQESRISAAKRDSVAVNAMEPAVLYQAETLYTELKEVSLI